MDRLLKILKDVSPGYNLENSRDFVKSGLLDSLDMIALVSNLEETYAITIEDREIITENLSNLTAIKELIEKHGGKV